MSWRKVSGVLCDRKLSAKVKGKMYKSVARPAILYEMEMVAVTKRQMKKMEVAELKMVRWALGVTRKDKIRNEYVRGTAKIAKLRDKLWNARLRWYGHVKKERRLHGEKDDGDGSARQKKKRKTKERMDLVREDIERVGARQGDEVDRVKWWWWWWWFYPTHFWGWEHGSIPRNPNNWNGTRERVWPKMARRRGSSTGQSSTRCERSCGSEPQLLHEGVSAQPILWR